MQQQIQKLKDALSNLDAKGRYYLFAIGLVVVLVLDGFIIMWPQVGMLMNVQKKTEILEGEILRLDQNLARMEDLRNQVRNFEDSIAFSRQSVHKREQIPMVLERISRAANEHRVKIDQMAPAQDSQKLLVETDDGKYYALSIVVKGKSGYHNVGYFLNQLEKEQLFVDISYFALMQNPKDSQKHLIDVTATILLMEPN